MWPKRLSHLLSGRYSKFAVLAAWIVIAAVVGPTALKLSEVLDNDQLGALPASAEAKLAQDRLAAAFPEPTSLVAISVYARDAGLTEADRAKIEADRAAFARHAEGGRIAPPETSANGRAMLLMFALAGDDDTQNAAVEEIKAQLVSGAPTGLRVALTGSAGATDDLFDAFDGMDSTLLIVTALAVALILIVTYRSPLLWLLPLIAVGIASQVASAAVYLLARHAGLTVDFQSQSILTIMVFGVGVDYALLLISRYREELRAHADRHEAMARALRRSFPAIAASAATVGLALLCLLFADLPATRGLGPVCAVGVLAAFVVMTTALPALVLLFGRWIFFPFVPRVTTPGPITEPAAQHRVWRRVAATVGRSPRAIWMVTAALLLALTGGIGSLGLGLPGDKSFTKEVGSITGQHLIESHFAAGTTAPAVVVTTSAAADQVAAAARSTSGVAEVLAAQTSADGRTARIRVILADPPESDAAMSTVERLRSAVHAVPGSLVGGETAIAVDTQNVAGRDDRVVMPLILAVVLLVLVLLLRAVVVPIVLLLSVVLSYFAALGAAGLILSAIGYPDLWVAIPLQTFLFLVALGVDYTIFLMIRAREEVAHSGHRTGILTALTVTGGVITSAGVVLAATFAALTVLPLVPSVQTAVIVVAGILLDTFLVRSLLVPALALHIGQKAWWPSRLAQPAAPVATPAPAHARV